MPVSEVLWVVGEGQLADIVCGELSMQHTVVRQRKLTANVPVQAKLALVLHDAWHPDVHHHAEEVLGSSGTPWLRGFVSFGEGIIGPLVTPGRPGCSQCADMRYLMAGGDRQEMWEMQENFAKHGGIPRDAWVTCSGLGHVAHLLLAEVHRILHGEKPRLEERMWMVNLKTLKSSTHPFLPNPQCPVCSPLPDDSSASAQIALQPSPKLEVESYRCRPMDELQQVLIPDYLDYRTGLLNGKVHDLVSPFASASVNLPLFHADEATAGRTLSYADSELTAVLEGLERYCGLAPRGKRTVMTDSFRNLGTSALNPMLVGVHDKEQYASPDFPFQPFHPDRTMNWVWGYSFLQEQPILVPELLAYYSLGCSDGFVYETSNGCAVGGSLEEAIFHGMLEVVERDSFLLTWYAQLPVPRLDIASARDEELRLMVDTLRAVTGYDLHLFDTTMENGIPSVWALAKNRKRQGIHLLCAAGAHLDPIRAVKSAVQELAGMLLALDEKYEASQETCLEMYRDPFKVRHMEDHSMLYSLPQAEERFQFLLGGDRPLRPFDEQYRTRQRHTDLTDDLKDMIHTFRKLHLDVIVVNQTTPELQRNGLHCVKVLIPGMLPMTFGHHLRRLEGLERVLQVPVDLGYASRTLTRQQLNLHPHPFP
jgi:ribosomal protein S12 methylthiotransferase accessory factor